MQITIYAQPHEDGTVMIGIQQATCASNWVGKSDKVEELVKNVLDAIQMWAIEHNPRTILCEEWERVFGGNA